MVHWSYKATYNPLRAAGVVPKAEKPKFEKIAVG
jgi:hypothetical protein